MTLKDFQQRLDATNKEITDLKAQLDSLLKAKDNAIAAGDDATAIRSRHELAALQERLEDLGIKKAAIEAKLQTYARNHEAAAKVRDEISMTWEQIRPLLERITEAQRDAAETLAKIAPLQAKIRTLAAKHIELTDEPFHPPFLQVPRQVADFAKLSLPPLASWRYVSEDDRKQVQAKREAEERARQAARAALAAKHAPACPRCHEPLTLRTDLPNFGEKSDGWWDLRCQKCNIVTSARIPESVGQSESAERVEAAAKLTPVVISGKDLNRGYMPESQSSAISYPGEHGAQKRGQKHG